MEEMEEIEIFIVGTGICGLATALALHRKGIKNVVLERSESLRASGACITIRTNGWRCLDQLGVGSDLNIYRRRAETRCMRRSDLIRILAESLPLGTIRLGCQILSVTLDPLTSYPINQLQNGSAIHAKSRFNLSLIRSQVLIGCDEANSAVAHFLELKPKILLSLSETRGFTNYPSGHGFKMEFFQVSEDDNIMFGRLPIDNKLVYWFVNQKIKPKASIYSLVTCILVTRISAVIAKDPELIHKLTLESMKDFPTGSGGHDKKHFRKGSVTVAGDAMHVMDPLVAQGGSASIEDGVVLARCLAQKSRINFFFTADFGEALDQYVKERRMRVVWLSSLHTLIDSTPPLLVRIICTILLMLLFSDYAAHTQYDCGRLWAIYMM
ncbi:hypothetical protein CIPAW_03G011600 [Carya illinoinensis]|uniref:FAD-binding domain-containing protein n=1 Tax=Carya illinoinensis TaxID=32201 RepID=A0A8T1QX83_CARIL|nr:hypothetical protein CIPAW_03G011600 [Carya illinoinensis]